MSIFDAYDQEFAALRQEIQKNVDELRAQVDGNGEQGFQIVNHIDALFLQSNDLIKQMDAEVRSHEASARKVLIGKVNQLKKSMADDKIEYERLKENLERSDLVGAKSYSDRQRLLATNEKLSKQDMMIANAQRTIAETEEIGLDITSELARNREKIESSRAKTETLTKDMTYVEKKLKSMQSRENCVIA